MARLLFCAALAINVLVCVPFLVDPLELLSAGSAAASGAVTEYVVILSEESPDARRAFFTERPALQVVHEGAALGILTVRVNAADAQALTELRVQPFAFLVARGGGVFCQ